MNTDNSKPVQNESAPRGSRFRRLLHRLRPQRKLSDAEKEAIALPPMTRGMRWFSMVAVFLLGVLLTWLVVADPLSLGFLPGRASGPGGSTDHEENAAAVVYQCPMHPEVIRDGPGECPICGMDLVEVKEPAGMEPQAAKTVYQCPMHPEVIQDGPGECPICGMDLVEVQAAPQRRDAEADDGVIRIDPVQVQNIGVVTVKATTADIARYSRTIGILDFDAENVTWVNTKFDGWIEKVHVNYVGQEVKQGQPLFEIYSPELVTTQEEYIRALDYRASLEGSGRAETLRQAESLVRSTRDRLAYWDITEEQIRNLETSRQVQRRLVVTSPAAGVVAEVMNKALEGMYIKPSMDLYKIADLSTVWVHADIYELDIPWIREGQPAVVSFRNAPEEKFRGRVLFRYPEVSRDTRTMKVCVKVPNPQRALRPGMYADVVIQGPPVKNAIVIPQSAVIRSGERNIVFVARGEGRFEPRDVLLGIEGEGDRIQILKGVVTGEEVVTQAQFMLDSESRMQEALAKFRSRGEGKGQPEAQPPAGHHVH